MKFLPIITVFGLTACGTVTNPCDFDQRFYKGECLERRGEGRTQATAVSAPTLAHEVEKPPVEPPVELEEHDHSEPDDHGGIPHEPDDPRYH